MHLYEVIMMKMVISIIWLTNDMRWEKQQQPVISRIIWKLLIPLGRLVSTINIHYATLI
jgi:hypothetical protein